MSVSDAGRSAQPETKNQRQHTNRTIANNQISHFHHRNIMCKIFQHRAALRISSRYLHQNNLSNCYQYHESARQMPELLSVAIRKYILICTTRGPLITYRTYSTKVTNLAASVCSRQHTHTNDEIRHLPSTMDLRKFKNYKSISVTTSSSAGTAPEHPPASRSLSHP